MQNPTSTRSWLNYLNKIVLKVICVSLIIFWPSLKIFAQNSHSDKPNIVLIVADDLGWNDVGAYGNSDVKTPHIDKLASEGMSFYGMHTATAMCAPTRQQLYSGLFPVRSGAYPNSSWSYDGVKSLPHYLRPLGYKVGITGKHHFGPPDSYPFKQVGDEGEINGDNLTAIEQFFNQDSPFALVVASHQPHKPWTKGNTKAYDPKSLTVPPYLVDTPEMRKELTQYYAEATYLDQEVGNILKILDDSGKRNNTLVIFTSEQGPSFPFAKWTCYEMGIKTTFVARWPDKIKPGSKNEALTQYVDVVPTLIEVAGGDPTSINTGQKDALGNAGFDGKSFLSSVLLNNKPHFRNYVYGIQTTLGIVGGSNPYPIRSISDGRYKLIRNLNADVKFFNITTPQDTTLFDLWEAVKKEQNLSWRSVNRHPFALIKSWKEAGKENINIAQRVLSYSERPLIEFYDLKNDPYEQHNLAGDPQFNQIIQELNDKLNSWMIQQGDKGLATEMNASSRLNASITKQKGDSNE